MRSLSVKALQLLTAVAAAVTLVACGQTAAKPDQGGSEAGKEAFPRTVDHVMGQTEIEQRPERVVALDNSFVDAALALDAEVVGYTSFTTKPTGLPDYLRDEPKGKNAEAVGIIESPNIEKVAHLEPDLILSAKVRDEASYDKLSRVAPTVFSQTTGATWKQNLRLVGEALGKETLAERKITEFEQRAEKIGKAIRAKHGEDTTVSMVRFAGEPTVRLYTPNSFIGVIIDDLGLSRPKGQPTSGAIAVNLSQERLLEVDAEHIFVSSYEDPTGTVAKHRRKFVTNPLWGRLKGEKHQVNDETWMISTGLLGANEVLDDMAKIFGVDSFKG